MSTTGLALALGSPYLSNLSTTVSSSTNVSTSQTQTSSVAVRLSLAHSLNIKRAVVDPVLIEYVAC